MAIDQRAEALPHRYRKQQREQDGREGERSIDQAHQQIVQSAAEIAGHDADGEADTAAGGECQQCHDQTDPRAVDQAAEDVASERIGSEDVLGATAIKPEWRHQLVGKSLVDRRIGSKQRGEDRHEHHDGDDGDWDPGHLAHLGRF